MSRVRVLLVLVVMTLVATGCGSRLSEEQRQVALGAFGAAGAPAGGAASGAVAGAAAGGSAGAAPASDLGTFDPAVLDAPTAAPTDGAAPAGPPASGTGGPAPGAPPPPPPPPGAPPGGGGAPAPAPPPPAPAPGAAPGAPAAGDTRAAPAGGNGGATDVGVTEDAIVVANISDVSGAVPGLFADAQFAVQAYLEYFAASEGTVYGRRFQYLPLDSRLETGGNRNTYLQACDQAFAAVGSMSAFEQGAVAPISGCGIPDVRTAAVNDQVMALPQVYPADASTVGVQPIAEYRFWQQQDPDAARRAAYLWIQADTTEFQTRQVIAATQQIGYEWVLDQPIDLAEHNYSSHVIEMRNRDVGYVTFQGAYQQAVRLAEAMRQQNFQPAIFALQSNAYSPDYLTSGGAAVEGTQIAVPSVILEEAAQHPELQVYAQWLNQVRPGARPTGLGIYAWSAARLFIDAVKAVGPELTRAALLEQLSQVQDFTGNGLLPPQDIGTKHPADCVVVVQARGGAFARLAPARDFLCDEPVRTR